MKNVWFSQALLEPRPQFSVWRFHRGTMVYLDREHLWIPPVFYTDLATIPNWSWPHLDTNPNQTSLAGAVHDYTARKDALIYTPSGAPHPISFELSIEIMDAVLAWSGVNGFDRWKIASALKISVVREMYWHKREVSWRPAGLP